MPKDRVSLSDIYFLHADKSITTTVLILTDNFKITVELTELVPKAWKYKVVFHSTEDENYPDSMFNPKWSYTYGKYTTESMIKVDRELILDELVSALSDILDIEAIKAVLVILERSSK